MKKISESAKERFMVSGAKPDADLAVRSLSDALDKWQDTVENRLNALATLARSQWIDQPEAVAICELVLSVGRSK